MITERLQYLDVAKGILIICLCFCHFPHAISYIGENEEVLLGGIDSWHYTFSIFFMQAFFFINGYCTNYNVPTKTFIWKSFKTLVIPALFFTVINRFVLASIYARTFNDFVYELSNGVGFWFLWSMFTCRIIYFFMHKHVRNDLLKAIICLTMLYIAFYSSLNGVKDYLYHQMTLSLCLFIFIGQMFCKNKKYFDIAVLYGWLYIPMLLAITYFRIPYSIISGTMNVGSYKEIFLYVLFATFGTFFSLWLAKLLSHIRILEMAGMKSLYIYGFHFFILCIVNSTLLYFIPDGLFENSFLIMILYYILSSILTLVSSLYISMVLSKFYIFRIVTGRF